MSIIVSTTLPDLRSWVVPVEDLAIAAAILGACVIVAVAAHRLAFGIIRKATAHGPARHGQPVVEAIRAPALWLAVTIAISAAAERAGMRMLPIGEARQGSGLTLGLDGVRRQWKPGQGGWKHGA